MRPILRETLMLGSSPCNEDCAQTTDPDYVRKAHVECRRYAAQMRRHYATRHAGKECPLDLRIKGNAHDFGTYYEVAVSFDPADRKQVTAAYWLEGNCPENWDTDE